MMYWPIQQELDCINDEGCILGKISFDANKNKHIFYPSNDSITLSNDEKANIAERLLGLDSAKYAIAMQDDD
ncbi:MAG: hypothetical protein HRU38_22065 [Saccharospirillaceae bacterium]|nr:hypothetical protein [Pseudomonadales bacterium]NRB81315.1 hypothetical protein [Saccharospirillaceae bacterium]